MTMLTKSSFVFCAHSSRNPTRNSNVCVGHRRHTKVDGQGLRKVPTLPLRSSSRGRVELEQSNVHSSRQCRHTPPEAEQHRQAVVPDAEPASLEGHAPRRLPPRARGCAAIRPEQTTSVRSRWWHTKSVNVSVKHWSLTYALTSRLLLVVGHGWTTNGSAWPVHVTHGHLTVLGEPARTTSTAALCRPKRRNSRA